MEGAIMRSPALMWLGAGVLLAGCGAAATSSSSPAGSETPMASTTVEVGSATVGGSSEQVLTDSSGHTLYYFAIDTPTTSMCSGSCAGYWPPLLQASGQPSGPSSLSGSLTVVTDANGRQVEYNDHLLYRYAGDTAAGQANGNGKNLNGGVWYVATPSTSMAGSGASASASPSPSGGGYSGY
jgi:predicted lipoprotein with Yx(FWY)xxD motif